ncbi:MAG: MBL fold metallo-hydrolase [Acidimicrobiales bacterium]|jgi:phosphoribosyl 1,2-cyclic phosphodiesterase
MRVHVCGVRGSTPASGREFVRYGGHTSCVAVAHDGEPPSLILDAGTGIRQVSTLLDGQPFRGSILLGHLHWDHTQGIPFFRSADNADARTDVYIPAQGDAEQVLEGFMSPPYFPITPGQLNGAWRFLSLEEGTTEIEGFTVLALEIPHKGGRTFGFRVSDGTSVISYLSDHCPISLGGGPEGLGEYHPAALTLTQSCDLLFHDSQYTDEELPDKVKFGHSSIGYAIGLAEASDVKRLLLYHHDPPRTDDQIDSILSGIRRTSVEIAGAAEQMVIDLPI